MAITPIEAVGEHWITELERRLEESERRLARHSEQRRAQPVLIADHLRVQSDRIAVQAAAKAVQAQQEQQAAAEGRLVDFLA